MISSPECDNKRETRHSLRHITINNNNYAALRLFTASLASQVKIITFIYSTPLGTNTKLNVHSSNNKIRDQVGLYPPLLLLHNNDQSTCE